MAARRTLSPERKKQLEEVRELERSGRLKEAFARLDQLMGEAPDDFYLWFRKVTLTVSHSSPKAGLEAAQEFRARFPDDRNAGLVMAMALLEPAKIETARAEEALHFLDEAESMGGPTDRSRQLRVKALAALGRSEEAKSVASAGTGLEAVWAKEMADGAKTEGEMEAVADRMRQLGEKEPEVRSYVGGWYAGHGRLDQAADVYEAALREFTDNERLGFELAMVERRRGRNDKAIRRLEELFERNPAEGKIAGALVQLYKERGNHVKAVRVSWSHGKAQAVLSKPNG